jgi:hypothetical protein
MRICLRLWRWVREGWGVGGGHNGGAPRRTRAVGLRRACVGGVGGGGGRVGALVHLPPIIAPFIEAMAASASSSVEKETKPKPLETPVSYRG